MGDTSTTLFRKCSARDACQQISEMVVGSAEPILLATQLAAYLTSHEFKQAVRERERDERAKKRAKQTVEAD